MLDKEQYYARNMCLFMYMLYHAESWTSNTGESYFKDHPRDKPFLLFCIRFRIHLLQNFSIAVIYLIFLTFWSHRVMNTDTFVFCWMKLLMLRKLLKCILKSLFLPGEGDSFYSGSWQRSGRFWVDCRHLLTGSGSKFIIGAVDRRKLNSSLRM